MEIFRYVTLLFLLRSKSLRLISVWNPTFLSLLVGRLLEYRRRTRARSGEGNHSRILHVARRPRERMQPNVRRANEVRTRASLTHFLREIHVSLSAVSSAHYCWADANAASAADRLGKLFPQAAIQGEGLIATEGFVSFPHTGCDGEGTCRAFAFPGISSRRLRGRVDREHPRLAHELDRGHQYSVVLTTAGGLYRYALHDLNRSERSLPQLPNDQISWARRPCL